MAPFRILLLLTAAVGLFLGCDRPFIEESPPVVTILSPDFGTVLQENTAILRLEATSFRTITRVDLGDAPMQFDPATETWEAELRLINGLNLFTVTAIDAGGLTFTDSLYAVYMPAHLLPAVPTLPDPLGNHTTTRLSNGALLVLGGARVAGGEAVPDALFLPFNATAFQSENDRLLTARAGHTTTALPDGRVLILGGARRDAPETVEDLIETAELFDPEQRLFKEVPVVGTPIRRADHTALMRFSTDGITVDVLGGRGNVRSDADPFLGTRRDLRSFVLRNDTLIALHPRTGPFIEALAGHTQTPLAALAPGQPGRYLILDSFFLDAAQDDLSFVLDYTDPLGLLPEPRAIPLVARTDHAAALLRRGQIVVLGGRQGTADRAIDDVTLYIDALDRFLTLPISRNALGKRFSLTATNVGLERILLLGGFTPDGTGTTQAAYFDFEL